MKENAETAKKYLELIAGGSFLFVLMGYFFGYSIFFSFLHSMLGLPVLTSMIFPPSQILFLGYLIIFSLLISIFVTSQIYGRSDGVSFSELIFAGVFLGMWSSNIKFHVFHFEFSSLLTKLFGTLILIIIVFVYFYLLRFRNKRKNKKLKLKKHEEFFSTAWLVYLFAILLPIFSSRGEHIIGAKTDIVTIFSTFYFEIYYVVSLLVILFNWFIEEKNNKKKSKFVTGLIFLTTILFLIYQFSSIFGKAIAESYIKNQEGMFSSISFGLNKEIDINGSNKTSKLNNLFLLSKDNDSYYVFQMNPNKLISIESSTVDFATMPDN